MPVPVLDQPRRQRGPGHQVRRARRDFLIASGATIALHRGGARHEPDHPVLAVPRFLDRRAEPRRGIPSASGGRAAAAPARPATAGPAASPAREMVRQAAGLARAHGSYCPGRPEWNATTATSRIFMAATLQSAPARLVPARARRPVHRAVMALRGQSVSHSQFRSACLRTARRATVRLRRAGPPSGQVPFLGVAGQRRGPLELRASLVRPSELHQEITAHAWQQVITAQRRLSGQRVDQVEPGLRPGGHRNGHRPVQLDHR